MKRISMIFSVMALVFAFTIASVSAQNAPKAKTSSEKVVSAKSDKAVSTTDQKDTKSCAKSCSHDDKAKAGCSSTCTGDKAKACCSKGAHTESAKPVPAPEKK